MNQATPMEFSPGLGYKFYPIDGLQCAYEYRENNPKVTWRFNPWTGERRDDRDIASDPTGLLIIPAGEPLYADRGG